MAHPPRLSAAPLAVIALSAVAGHALVWAPLADRDDRHHAHDRFGPGHALPTVRIVPPPPPPGPAMREALPRRYAGMWIGPFDAARVEPGAPWRASFRGRTAIGPEGTVVELERSTIEAGPAIRAGRIASLRLGLAEASPDGGWTMVREGPAVPSGVPVRAGRMTLLDAPRLHLPGAGWGELDGRWLVVTVESETAELGRSVTHVHMDRDLTRALVDRARRQLGPRRPLEARR